MLNIAIVTFCRSYKVVRAFRQKPKGPQIVDYMQPVQRFNSLLLRLRHMGLYHDQHLVRWLTCRMRMHNLRFDLMIHSSDNVRLHVSECYNIQYRIASIL